MNTEIQDQTNETTTIVQGGVEYEVPVQEVASLPDLTSKKGAPKVFSDEDIANIISLWNENRTVKDIAQFIDRPFVSVRNKIAAMQKKGLIAPRSQSNKLPEQFVEQTAGVHQLPTDLVQYFTTLFSGGADRIIEGVNKACEAYRHQNGSCFYLKNLVRLTQDNSPSGVVPMYMEGGELILVCRSVAVLRSTMGHKSFVNMCKYIAKQFENDLV